MRQVLQEGLEVYIHQARREGKQGCVSVDPLVSALQQPRPTLEAL